MKIEEITFNKLIGTYIQLLNVVKMKKSQFQKRFSTYYIVFRILYVYRFIFQIMMKIMMKISPWKMYEKKWIFLYKKAMW